MNDVQFVLKYDTLSGCVWILNWRQYGILFGSCSCLSFRMCLLSLCKVVVMIYIIISS